MQSPDQIAEKLVGAHTVNTLCPIAEPAELTRLIAAALQSFGDERATAERDRICAYLAGENFGVGTYDAIRAAIDAIRALAP